MTAIALTPVKVRMTSVIPTDELCDLFADMGGEVDWDGCGWTYATFPDEQSMRAFEEAANKQGIQVEDWDGLEG